MVAKEKVIERENVVVVRRATAKVMEKYKDYIKPREEFIEYTVRGAKAQKIAEIAEVVKYLSIHDATKSFQIPQVDFEKAYGVGKKGINYVLIYLKKFGIPHPRVVASQDMVHIWSKNAIK